MTSDVQKTRHVLLNALMVTIVLAMITLFPYKTEALTQEGLTPTTWDPGKVHVIVYKTKAQSAWDTLAGGFSQAALYLGQHDGQPYVLQAVNTGNPPVLETLNAFLNRIDGTVDAIIWALGDGSIDPATAYSLASSVSSSSLVYPPVKEDLAGPILTNTDALELKISNYFYNRGTYLESSIDKAFFESFGPKDPMASQQILSTLYHSQLDYLFYKYLGSVNLENNSPQFVADFSNRIVTPLELILGANKRIVYSAKFNSTGVPTVSAKASRNGTLYIDWTAAPGMEANDGYTGTIMEVSGKTGRALEAKGLFDYNAPVTNGIIFTTPANKKKLVIGSLPTGEYQVSVMGAGNIDLLIKPDATSQAVQTVKVINPGASNVPTSTNPSEDPGDTSVCGPQGSCNTPQSWAAWAETLSSAGYTVTRGSVYEVDNAACAKIVSVFGTCFGNNAAAPYIIPQVPVVNTYLDPYYAPPFNAPGLDGANSNMVFRLSDNDALVTVINLPPRAAYLGYQSYLFSRDAATYLAQGITPEKYTPDPSRAEIFGSLGNAVNNVIIHNQSGAQWSGNTVMLITTSNRNLADALAADARAKGMDKNFIFVEPVGANIITGSGSSSDDMITLIRYALPEDASASSAWNDALASNVLVYRVSNPAISAARFSTPVYTVKNSGDESMYQSSLNELSNILALWLTAKEKRVALEENMITSDHTSSTGEPTGLVGAQCIANGKSCLGDSQDTDAYRLGVVGRLEGTQLAIVTGVNHTLTNMGSYISLAIYNMENFSGVASGSQTNPQAVGFDSGILTGSAEAVLKALNLYILASSQLKAQLPMLYVALVSRQCEEATDYCIELNDTTLLPLAARISITQRAYVKPGTTTGGNPDTMLTPKVIFAPR